MKEFNEQYINVSIFTKLKDQIGLEKNVQRIQVKF